MLAGSELSSSPKYMIALALYTFMADALHVAHQGTDAVPTVLPTTFNWAVFVGLMAAPVVHMTWRGRRVVADEGVGVLRRRAQHAILSGSVVVN